MPFTVSFFSSRVLHFHHLVKGKKGRETLGRKQESRERVRGKMIREFECQLRT